MSLLLLVPTDWRYVFVANFEALSCQVTRKLIRCRNAEIPTISAIKYTACYQLGVFHVSQWFEICFQFSHFVFSVFKRFSFFSVGKVSDGKQTSSMACFGFALACATFHCAWLCGCINTVSSNTTTYC